MMSENSAEPAKIPAPPLSGARRIGVIVISSIIAITLIMTLLFYFTRNSGVDFGGMSVAEVHDLTSEQVEGLQGLIEISHITLQDSEDQVFDEEPRDDLRAEQTAATQFLADLPDEANAATKEQAIARYDRVEEQFGELFEAIRLVQVAVTQFEDAH